MDSNASDGHSEECSSEQRPFQARPHSRSSQGGWTGALRDAAPYLDLGWRLAGMAAGPPGLGVVLDVWLGTRPWLLLIGCLVGFGGAVLQLVRLRERFDC